MVRDESSTTGRVWRDRGLVVLAATIVLVTLVPVTQLYIEAWESNRVVYHLSWVLATSVGGNLGTLDAFGVAVLVGWLVLFGLDDYKRVQFLIMVVAGGLFVMVLLSSGLWQIIDWSDHVLAMILGLLLGLGTGLYGHTARARTDGGWVPVVGRFHFRFPMAARLLYGVIAIGTTVAFLERYVPYSSPVVYSAVPVDPATPGSASATGFVVHAVSAVLLVGTVNYFVEYTDYRRVVLSSPSDKARVDVIAGLFDTVNNNESKEYNAQTTKNGRQLNELVSKSPADVAKSVLQATPLGFRFDRPGLLNRQTVVEAYAPRALNSNDARKIEKITQGASVVGRNIRRTLTVRFLSMLPRFVEDALQSGHRSHISRYDDSDVLLLVIPLSNYIDEHKLTRVREEHDDEDRDDSGADILDGINDEHESDSGSVLDHSGSSSEEDDVETDRLDRADGRLYPDDYDVEEFLKEVEHDEYLDTCRRIHDAYAGTIPKVYVVPTDAQLALELFRIDRGTYPEDGVASSNFNTFVVNTLLESGEFVRDAHAVARLLPEDHDDAPINIALEDVHQKESFERLLSNL